MLKYKLKKIVEVQDWDSFVMKNYHKPYSFQQQDGCKERGIYTLEIPSKYAEDFENDEIPFEINGDEMGVSLKSWINTNPVKGTPFTSTSDINLFWERNFYPNIEMIANDLYSKGLLEAGNYTINIDW